ncbi:MAG: hypothetical protein IPM29_09640 [Planctomycetes bacterium]|nr:hypothetical protein [Planctomycetota bacterium]
MTAGAPAEVVEGAAGEPLWLKRAPWLAVAAFVCVCTGYLRDEWLHAGRLGPPLDDGWIYMAFARSLASGEGITYPGHDGPVCAVTGPIWCALLALAMKIAGPSVWIVKACGIVTGAIAVLGTFRLGRVAAGGDARIGAVAALLLAVTPRFVWGCLSGMEVPFYVAGTVIGLAGHLERRTAGALQWTLRAALPLALAGWARPECLVLPFLAAAHRRRLDGFVAAAVLVAVFPAYHLVVSGHPLPTTFYVKAAASTPLAVARAEGVGPALAAWAESTVMQVAAFLGYLPTHLPWLALGLFAGVRRGLRERDGVPFLAFVLLAFAIARGSLGFAGPWFQQGRYFAQLWPVFAIVCLRGFDLGRRGAGAWLVLGVVAAGFALEPKLTTVLCFDWNPGDLPEGLDRARWALVIGPALAAALLAGVGLASVLLRQRRPAAPPLVAVIPWLLVALALGGARHAMGVADTYDLNVRMAEEVRRLVPPGDTVACHDLGALGYFADRPLLDLAGLGSPEVAFRPRAAGQLPDRLAILRERKPRWLCVTPDMVAAINPAGGALPELIGAKLVADVDKPDNVTVLGGRYQLIELTWRD